MLEEISKFILVVAAIALIMFTVGFVVNFIQGLPQYHYEYVDMGGESGVADRCYMSYGNMSCNSGDMTIQVQSYTRIRDN